MKTAEKPIRVLIVGDHPHKGTTGTMTGVIKQFPWGTEMAEVRMDDGTGCFAEAKNLMQIHA